MKRLHGCNNLIFCQAAEVIRSEALNMLNAVAQSRQRFLFFDFPDLLEGIQNFVIGAVADGVDGKA